MKTRLAASLGQSAALELYTAFAGDTLEWLGRFPARRHVFYTPGRELERCRALAPAASQPLEFVPQAAGGLGRRLHAAFASMFAAGVEKCVVVGTDCPLLEARRIHRAFRELDHAQVVLGPATDGGYYLIGLSAPLPGIFVEIPWSTAAVLEATLARARRLGAATALLAPLSDVDTAEDLLELGAELVRRWRSGSRYLPRRTFQALQWSLPPGSLGWQVRGGDDF